MHHVVGVVSKQPIFVFNDIGTWQRWRRPIKQCERQQHKQRSHFNLQLSSIGRSIDDTRHHELESQLDSTTIKRRRRLFGDIIE